MKQKKKTLSPTKEQQLESKVRKLQKENRDLKKELQTHRDQVDEQFESKTLADEATAAEDLGPLQIAPTDDDPAA